MIGVFVKGISTLKILQPIMLELHKAGQEYILLYCIDAPKKKFNDSSLENIKKSSKNIVNNATKCVPYSKQDDLSICVKENNIKKIIGLEIYSWAHRWLQVFKKTGVKLYSISYLIDSFWGLDEKCITAMDKVYYTTKYIKETLHKFLGISDNPDRDRLLGSPLLPYPVKNQNLGDKMLILLPNMKEINYGKAFSDGKGPPEVGADYYRAAIRALAHDNTLIFKTRPKQWLDSKIKQFAEQIFTDGSRVYPPPTWKALKQSNTTVLHFSSGIFETVCSGNYVINIPISLRRYKAFGFPKERVRIHFSDKKQGLYNYKGVVESVRLCNISSGKWKLTKKIDLDARKLWIEEFVGPVYKNSAKEIVNDIISN